MSMRILPPTAKVTRTRPASRVHRLVQINAQEDPVLERMRDCLEVAFPPAGQATTPAARVWSSGRVSAEPALTELSFGSSVPERLPEALDAEQRSERREQLSVYRVAALRWRSGEALCLIRNLSSGGLMGRLAATLMPGEPVEVEIRSGAPIAAHVAWTGDGMIGLAFDERIQVLDVLHASVVGSPGLLQRMPRIRVSCPVGLIVGEVRQQATLADISQGGVKLSTDMLRAGEAVQVAVQGLDPRRGIVRWTQRGCAGVSFLNPIPFDALARWARNGKVNTDPTLDGDGGWATKGRGGKN